MTSSVSEKQENQQSVGALLALTGIICQQLSGSFGGLFILGLRYQFTVDPVSAPSDWESV
ncbi:MAG: hypothetical protein KDA86_03890 [Planctomycetaceae bacterium]|nr:hypothetical protein [Planctomycetaceae bacterium]